MLRKICVVLLFCCCAFPSQALSTSAQSAILMELESGRILYEENIDQESLIASITKLMTALLALESEIPLQEIVPITAEACLVEGSSLYLHEETEITLEGLLYGLMLHSGNDAAVAIAIACSGSQEAFVAEMNDKAVELGMENSQFANPHGLNQENHYSTARDMAILAQACLQNESLAKMVATQNISIDGRTFTNKNKLLWSYEDCIGMKTGYTQLAGRTLVSAAKRDGMTLICVTLDDRNDWVDHSNLFDYGFQQYAMVTGEDIQVSIPMEGSLLPFALAGTETSFSYPLTEGEILRYELLAPTAFAVAPVYRGQVATGQVQWFLGEVLLAEIPLVYQETHANLQQEKENFWTQMTDFFHDLF